jgi:arylsulfatase A-like enzyme
MQVLLSTSIGRRVQDWIYSRTVGNRLLFPKTAGDINRAFLGWVARNPGRPFFAFLNYFDAHGPFHPPKPYDELFGPQDRRIMGGISVKKHPTQEQIQAEIDAYDGSIAYLDEEIGRLMNELERRGLKENTLIIITSDH